MNSKKILIADDMHGCIISLMEENGFEPVYSPLITREEILAIIDGFIGLVIRSKTSVDRELIDAGKQLKFVARAGAGMDKVDYEYLKSKGIEVINAPEGNRDALGEHAIGMLLSLLHKIPYGNSGVGNGKWDREGNRGIELKGKIVGVYGVGNMGMSFAKKLSGFECEVIGYDKYKKGLDQTYIKQVDLQEFMDKTEILSIHIPLHEETKYLFDSDYLRKFPNLKVLINTSRGEVLRTKDLVGLMEDESIYGACLDVLENEKITHYSKEEKALLNKLTGLPNVIITPHVGGWTFESYERISEVIAEKIISFNG